MAYPFPGMNPYLEHKRVWHDFHNGLICRIRDAIVPGIRPRYFASTDDNVYIHELTDEQRYLLGRPDVAVLSTHSDSPPQSVVRDVVRETYSPGIEGMLPPETDEVRELFIEIRDQESREVITIIELLSPTNKRPGDDRNQYLAKRKQILRSTTHFVEIDLLRGGVRMDVGGLPQCDYAVMVSRYEDRPKVGLWPMRMRERLPTIPIPLANDDPDVPLDLQAVIEAQFEAAGYADYVYSYIPQPPLHPEDDAWAKGLRGIE